LAGVCLPSLGIRDHGARKRRSLSGSGHRRTQLSSFPGPFARFLQDPLDAAAEGFDGVLWQAGTHDGARVAEGGQSLGAVKRQHVAQLLLERVGVYASSRSKRQQRQPQQHPEQGFLFSSSDNPDRNRARHAVSPGLGSPDWGSVREDAGSRHAHPRFGCCAADDDLADSDRDQPNRGR
jgi:hypothetical protein